MLTLAAAVGSRYGMFDDTRSARVTHSGKELGALSVFVCVSVCVNVTLIST